MRIHSFVFVLAYFATTMVCEFLLSYCTPLQFSCTISNACLCMDRYNYHNHHTCNRGCNMSIYHHRRVLEISYHITSTCWDLGFKQAIWFVNRPTSVANQSAGSTPLVVRLDSGRFLRIAKGENSSKNEGLVSNFRKSQYIQYILISTYFNSCNFWKCRLQTHLLYGWLPSLGKIIIPIRYNNHPH